MSNHTPGPWGQLIHGMKVTAHDHSMTICDIRGWGYLTGTGGMNLSADDAISIQQANANLIAAAPDLLEALKSLVAGNEQMLLIAPVSDRPHVVDDGYLVKARAAIALAEGCL